MGSVPCQLGGLISNTCGALPNYDVVVFSNCIDGRRPANLNMTLVISSASASNETDHFIPPYVLPLKLWLSRTVS
jgi:hypothetical protein